MTAPTDATRVDPMSVDEILALPAIVPVWPTASAALGGSPAGLSRPTTYARAKAGTYPVPVLLEGRRRLVRRADVLAYLGINGDGARVAPLTPLAEHDTVPTV
ncbi:helix-turn-helix transcriptional regulator [Streptacidiphilus anmyonensis]|uniref:helix-turn-helix transcriptional regulator n=1 Tax=Streptacidiphilus anmyonensis TaxID=405782 RepID=UPI00069428B2|nr:hypothetical protein [Streptacidiphilus anmyonensis]